MNRADATEPLFSGDPDPDAAPRVKPGEPAALAVASSLRAAVARLHAADLSARNGEAEGVHRLRTSARRLRSELHAFRDLVEPDWREELEGELKWLGGALGQARDLDVLLERFRTAVEGLDAAESAALGSLFEALDARRESASRAMRTVLRSARRRRLFAALEQSAANPPLLEKAGGPCRKVLPPLVERSWKRLRKEAEALDPESADAAFHEARKLAKRARYTAERIAPTLGRRGPDRAARYIRLTTAVQDALGAHQDMTVAVAEVEALRLQRPDDQSFQDASQVLLTRLREAADDARAAFFVLWPKLAKKKHRRWFMRRN